MVSGIILEIFKSKLLHFVQLLKLIQNCLILSKQFLRINALIISILEIAILVALVAF
jgi:hypothetical protein